MQIYFLAVNLFALAALLLGLGNFTREARSWRLAPLFLLVIIRSLSLIVSMTTLAQSQIVSITGTLEVLSAFCILWTLAGWTFPWPKLGWISAAGTITLACLPFFPNWPVPIQLHLLIIALLSAVVLAFGESGKIRWFHLTTPLCLALAGFLVLLNLMGVAWLITLLAYVLFISAIHYDSIQVYQQLYFEQQRAAASLVQEALEMNREQRRWLEASELISAVPNLNQSMEHIVRSMAQLTQTEQAAIFMLDPSTKQKQIRLATLYSPERPLHLSTRDEITVGLEDYSPLQEAIEKQQQLVMSPQQSQRLTLLYSLWHEDRTGPTLLQPLTVQGRPAGVLLLGNPVTSRPIREQDQRLCRTLAPQIATLVEHRRRYLQLEAEAETLAAVTSKKDNSFNVMDQSSPRPQFEEIDIIIIIDEALHDIAPLIKQGELKLKRDIKDDLPRLKADPHYLRQILDNLLLNACQFTPPGGAIILKAWLQEDQVKGLERSKLRLAVADSGIGIPVAEQKRIFDPNYHLKSSSQTTERGLALVKKLVELHQGQIRVESVPGKGSIFYVDLPLTQN
ncbi:MAG: sensor histidine kinase [Anaerolineae bacterium]